MEDASARVLVGVLLAVSGCYAPVPPAGRPCAADGACPSGLSCVAGVCAVPGGVDAPAAPGDASADAAVDAPRPVDAPPGLVQVVLGDDPAELADTFLWEADPGANYAASDHMAVDAGEVGLVRFDLAAIPAGSTIVAATLQLAVSDAAATSGEATLHRVGEAWREGEATWTSRQTGLGWSALGAAPPARDAASLGGFSPTELGAPYAVTLPVKLVEEWVQDGALNHGLAIARGTAVGHIHLATKDHPTIAGPRLTVTYAP